MALHVNVVVSCSAYLKICGCAYSARLFALGVRHAMRMNKFFPWCVDRRNRSINSGLLPSVVLPTRARVCVCECVLSSKPFFGQRPLSLPENPPRRTPTREHTDTHGNNMELCWPTGCWAPLGHRTNGGPCNVHQAKYHVRIQISIYRFVVVRLAVTKRATISFSLQAGVSAWEYICSYAGLQTVITTPPNIPIVCVRVFVCLSECTE